MVKRYKKTDPFLKRETELYESPVASREFILQFFKEQEKTFSLQKLIKAFSLKTDDEKEGLRRRMCAMERDGQLMVNRRGHYAMVDEMELLPGRIEGHRDGFGFFIPDNGSDDIFLPARQMREVFSDDRVLIRVTGTNYRGRQEGVIVEIIERNTHQVVGRFIEEGGATFVDPDSKSIAQDIIIPPQQVGGAKPGQFVVVEIINQPTKRRQATGKVVDILGDIITPGLEVELALRSHELPFEWPDEVIAESDAIPDHVTDADRKGRKDLRDLHFVTIDGEDARDFDDAIFCKKNGTGWTLYVAIADVTHYMKPGSALDTEAIARGNSVYFPSKVIPMLPEKLSNGLCSLKPNVDRLAMVCEMQIDKKGCLESYDFFAATIHSHARLTYTFVAKALKEGKTDDAALYPHLKEFHNLFEKLLASRHKRGAIEFNTVETQIVFDENSKISKIIPRHRNEAHRMIEEAMLLANVSSADFLERAEISALYRNHEHPEEAKLLSLRDFLKVFALKLGGGNKPSPADYSTLLAQIEKRPDFHLLQTVMLRSMRQATYGPVNRGHFGLAFERYTHFTSPIRRYPDVVVHRGIKHLVAGKKVSKFMYDVEMIEDICSHCSLTERRADLATRDATDWLKCEFMQDKVGKEFEGFITDVTGFGVFIELKDIYVQGLVHITALKNDYYHYDSTHHLLRGKKSGKSYQLGDRLKVLVARVDLDKRQIDFELV
ncbi:MAG: ribonuclease R [Coxiella sp. (in: Bacteria)]|nr:MAG: ribonuclease R [Coxiella sp. (in: g-proteobacteria)]